VSAANPISLRRFTLQAGVAGFLLMLGYLTLFWESSQPAQLLRNLTADPVDFYLVEPRGVRFDSRGQPLQTLAAERLTHYQGSDQSLLQMPRFTAAGSRGETWSGTAREGRLIGDQQVQLRGDVVLVDDKDGTRLLSEALDWFPDGERVESDAAVKFTQAGQTTTGIGLRARLDSRRIELLHQVEGIHVLR
jgi:LPS export ABC transporter protein LptC